MVPFDALSITHAVERLVNAALVGVALPVRLSNSYVVSLASSDSKYRELLNGPGLNFADGAPVAYLMNRWSGKQASVGRVRGPSLFVESLKAGVDVELRHFFLGSSEEALRKMVSRAQAEIPGIIVSGAYSPPFGPLNESFYSDSKRLVKDAGAQIVWVGLGSPKQDYACKELAFLLDAPCVGVGAAFDFYAGTVREAPEWVQRVGLEWLFRLLSEPRRLWRRYLFGNIIFLISAFKGKYFSSRR
ncbi:WecB/TagA/CpsF family glycosyltransferase [Rhodococcus sp. BS-15]|uniref:WecB/TagA/CpsF family glycosyltransferase n=1 Tax=Rhodococcus sp. BS-15 TaxID=1304954 RepID=UPI000FFC21A8|nr:WecB/TagA/CpsF family glycosyltransferase [Rhodococcus sp. BS-15]